MKGRHLSLSRIHTTVIYQIRYYISKFFYKALQMFQKTMFITQQILQENNDTVTFSELQEHRISSTAATESIQTSHVPYLAVT